MGDKILGEVWRFVIYFFLIMLVVAPGVMKREERLEEIEYAIQELNTQVHSHSDQPQ